MNKFFNMNSFFTKIILAVLSFAVIVCVFIPYMRIPAVTPVQDINVENKTIDRKIGVDQPNFSITEFVHSSSPAFELYKDIELLETVNKAEIPLNNDINTFYFATYAYGYDANNKDAGLKSNLLGIYEINFIKDAKNNALVAIKTSLGAKAEEGLNGVINVTVPKTKVFDLTKIIASNKAWFEIKNGKTLPFPADDQVNELKNMVIKPGEGVAFFAAMCLKAEADNMYYPLDVYNVYVECDTYRKTLPTVGEIGGGILSKVTPDGIEFYEKDMFMFIFMIMAAIITIFAFTIPNQFRIIETIIAVVMGIGLAVIPIIDIMFYSQHKFELDPGCFILIALGVLLIFWSIFDFIRCTSEYKKEMIHLYGEDFFSKERKIRMKEERKVKDAEFKVQKKADKIALKEFKAEETAKLKEYKAQQKKNKK